MQWHKRTSMQLLVIFAVACALRFGVIVVRYTPDLQHFSNGDYTLYSVGAEDILQRGSLDNSLFLIRPPLFPVMVALLNLNGLAVLAVNAVLGALVAPLTYVLARRCRLSTLLSLLAALVVAVDPASIVYSAFLGAEALANVTLLAGVYLLLVSLERSGLRASGVLVVIGGVLLVFSSLSRPATFLLWGVLGVWAIVFYRRRWVVLVAFGLISVIGVGGWIVHNGVVFGNYTFSTIGLYNLLYYRAASVESRGAGLSIDETYTELSRRVEARLGHDTSTVDAGTRYRHEAVTAELQPIMQSVAIETFLAYPVVYVSTIPIGLYRILALTQVEPSWVRMLVMIWNVVLVVGTGIGLILFYRAKQWDVFWLIVLICAYYIGGTLVVQTSGIDTRARTMITPFMAIAVVRCLEGVIRLRLKRSEAAVGSVKNG